MAKPSKANTDPKPPKSGKQPGVYQNAYTSHLAQLKQKGVAPAQAQLLARKYASAAAQAAGTSVRQNQPSKPVKSSRPRKTRKEDTNYTISYAATVKTLNEIVGVVAGLMAHPSAGTSTVKQVPYSGPPEGSNVSPGKSTSVSVPKEGESSPNKAKKVGHHAAGSGTGGAKTPSSQVPKGEVKGQDSLLPSKNVYKAAGT